MPNLDDQSDTYMDYDSEFLEDEEDYFDDDLRKLGVNNAIEDMYHPGE